MTKEILKQNLIIKQSAKKCQDKLILDFVKQVVYTYYGVKDEDFDSKSRRGEILKARQASMYILAKNTNIPLVVIGRYFNKHHSTVIHVKKTFDNYLIWDKVLKKEITSLTDIIEIKVKTISNNLDLQRDFYYIDLNNFLSIKMDSEKAIIFKGFKKDDILKINLKNILTYLEPRIHENTRLYILEKNEVKKNEDKG